MSEPIWGDDDPYHGGQLPQAQGNASPPEGFGSTLRFIIVIAFVLALVVGLAYLFVVYFPDIGLLNPTPATPTIATPTPTGTPFPTPSPTPQPSPSPTTQPSPSPTVQPSPTPSPQPSPTPQPSPSPTPRGP